MKWINKKKTILYRGFSTWDIFPGKSLPIFSWNQTIWYVCITPPGKDRWRNSDVLICDGPLQIAAFWGLCHLLSLQHSPATKKNVEIPSRPPGAPPHQPQRLVEPPELRKRHHGRHGRRDRLRTPRRRGFMAIQKKVDTYSCVEFCFNTVAKKNTQLLKFCK